MEKAPTQETVIYGGAFNPPTRAHQAILQACVDYAEPRQADVWLLPSASRIDKQIEVSRDDRLTFCQALTRDVIRRTVQLGVATTELDRAQLTETFDTVQELESLYPDRRFTWVFGADSAASMGAWDHGAWLQEHLSMLVISRPGTPFLKLGPKVLELVVDAGDYSSTALRQRIANGQPYDDLVGEEVFQVLARKNAMLEVC